MLVIISDLHLGDGSAADSIPASAFYLFAKRLRQDAYFAAMNYRTNYTKNELYEDYQPIDEVDVLLMGDILDPLHSTRWLFPLQDEEKDYGHTITEPGTKYYVRPWTDQNDPRFAKKLKEVTEAVLDYNQKGLEVFRNLAEGKPASFESDEEQAGGLPDELLKHPLKVNFYYLVGNHDWYYHLKGPAFDEIRELIKEKLGLRNQPSCPFPFDLGTVKPESHSQYSNWKTDIEEGNHDAIFIKNLLQDYKVFARHGDYYDMFNFDIQLGRDHSTLGDAFTMEVCNRFPEQLIKDQGFSRDTVASLQDLRQMTNIRPSLATPLWITGQLKKLSQEISLQALDESGTGAIQKTSKDLENTLKEIWDRLADNFLNLDFVRKKDKWGLDIVDKMQIAVKLSKAISSTQLDSLVYLVQSKSKAGGDRSFAQFALKEPALIDKNDPTKYIVYGHTHHHETIPLDYDDTNGIGAQIYFNSGTWHTYFDLARKDPRKKKFVPYKALTYITFYKDKIEHGDQNFETWSGAYA